MPRDSNRRATLEARAADSSQFDGKAKVAMGMLSVWPSMRSGFGKASSASASDSSTGLAEDSGAATPEANSRSDLISISSHSSLMRTRTWSRSIIACSASTTRSEISESWRSARLRAARSMVWRASASGWSRCMMPLAGCGKPRRQ